MGPQWVLYCNTNFQEFEGEEYIFAYIQDISDRKKAEIEKTRLVSVIEQSKDSIIITDLKGNIEYANPAFEQITGYTVKEVFQKNPRFLKSGRHDQNFYKEIWETIISGKIWAGRLFNKRKDGRLIQESATIFPITNSKGEITNYASVKRDVTEQLRLEEQLQQTQKLEAIGTLAGGIAHDFNNILGAIYGYTQLAQKKLSANRDHVKVNNYLEKIRSAGIRAEELVNQILTFSRKADFKPETIELRPLFKESIKFLQASLPSTISINHSIAPDIKNVLGDYTQIHQIILNLCTNASHAMEYTGGELEIKLSNFRIVRQSPETCNLAPGDYVLLYVRDTGIGMEEGTRRRIFEPFFTTKEKGKGTGLGLSVVHGIIKKHRGGIKVYSQPDKGTKISVYLPVSDDATAIRKTNLIKDLPTGSESILLVDDESDIAYSYGEMLKMQGYKVKVMIDSTEAFKEFSRQDTSYDLVITDYTMPGMDGIKLSRKILAHRPSTSIMIISGLGELISNEEIEAAGIKKRMSKPVEIEQLLASIRSILDK